MDLEPFAGINPCGYEGLEVTDLRTLCGVAELARFRADSRRISWQGLSLREASEVVAVREAKPTTIQASHAKRVSSGIHALRANQ